MRGKELQFFPLNVKEWMVSFKVEGDAVAQAKKCFDDFHETEIGVEIKKYSGKRTLDQNSYFHALCREVGMSMSPILGEDAVKKMMVLRYGTYARDDDGKVMGAAVPENTNIELFYPYCKRIGEQEVNGKTQVQYLFLKHTHMMNRSEMSKLIEGAVEEAKELGINVLSREELEALK